MKMPEAQFEIVLFDARDVIATSGVFTPVDDSSVSVIWLSLDSVKNFNAISKANKNYFLLKNDGFDYNAYSGAVGAVINEYTDEFMYYAYSLADYANKPLNAEQEKGLRVVDADGKGYAEVLSWLNTHGQK